MPAQKQITLLGGLKIEKDGKPISKLISRKADLLLAYLAYEGRSYSRESLATLLWDDRPQKQASSNLRTLLSSLRKNAADFVNIERHTVSIQSDVVVDCALFKQQIDAAQQDWPGPAAAQQLETALKHYVGDFLEGIHTRNSAALEDWLHFTQEQLQQQFLDNHQQLSAYYLQQGAYNNGIRHTAILLEKVPWNEVFHRQMMQLLARSGQRQAALAQYETCVQILKDELGVSPEPATTALFERIQTATEVPSVRLPAIATTFVGREYELGRCIEYLRDPDCRLLTITGLGGIGKTRLAVQVAESLETDFLNGVYFISLAAVELPKSLMTVIAEAIDAPFSGGVGLQEKLQNFLNGKEMLLVIDNFEHLMPAARQLSDLLDRASGIKLLVTSRIRLNLRAEWLFELSGLAYADGDNIEADEYAAIRLFDQRARVVSPGFSLSAENITSVNRICQIVHGMPLGIEMAAAWMRVLSPENIAQQIEQNLDFLTTTLQDVPARQRNLTAIFDSVWGLLNENEQRAFAQLSVFRGNFTIAAFQQITKASTWVLATLVEKSLLQKDDLDSYLLVELLRLYSRDKLDQDARIRIDAYQEHSAYYLGFLQDQQEYLRGRKQAQALQAIQAERENIRAAWLWAAQQVDIEALNKSCWGLTRFYQLRGPFNEGLQLLQTAIIKLENSDQTNLEDADFSFYPRPPDLPVSSFEGNEQYHKALSQLHLWVAVLFYEIGLLDQIAMALEAAESFMQSELDPALVARIELQRGLFYWRKSELELSSQWIHRSLNTSRKHKLYAIEAWALRILGAIAIRQSDYKQAEFYYQAALPVAHKIGDLGQEAKLINNLGVVYTETGDFKRAKEYHLRALEMKKELGDLPGQSMSLNNMGMVTMGQGYYSEALNYFEKSLGQRRYLGYQSGESLLNINLGQVYFHLGQYDQAEEKLLEALRIARELGSDLLECESLVVLGIVHTQAGEYEDGYSYYQQGMELAAQRQYRTIEGHAHYGIGQCLLGMKKLDRAVDHFHKALALREELGERNMIIESRAGIAAVFLAQDKAANALEQVEIILTHLQEHDLSGTENPFAIHLVCCQVMVANGDERFDDFLAESCRLLHERADSIDNPALKQSYLTNVPAHVSITALCKSSDLAF